VRRFALSLSIALVAASAPALVPMASAAEPTRTASHEPPAAPDQLLVGYDIGTSTSERADARGSAGARNGESDSNWATVTITVTATKTKGGGGGKPSNRGKSTPLSDADA
jgi:hypothetical protein